MADLFQLGRFRLHSGHESGWKIDCDALSDGDLAALAAIGAAQLGVSFGEVVGIPRGGLRFAEALRRHADPSSRAVLIVDDVLTTGNSMFAERDRLVRLGHVAVYGLVIFARTNANPCVARIFQMRRPPDAGRMCG